MGAPAYRKCVVRGVQRRYGKQRRLVLQGAGLPVVTPALSSCVQWMRRVAGLGAISVAALLFLPAERVPIPSDYGGSQDGATVVAPADGPTLFAEQCASCHGLGGEGGRGPSLVGRVEVIGRDNSRRQITKGGMSMPAFGRILTQSEIEAILDYLATKDGRRQR